MGRTGAWHWWMGRRHRGVGDKLSAGMGTAADAPELLDYLAASFIHAGIPLKA